MNIHETDNYKGKDHIGKWIYGDLVYNTIDAFGTKIEYGIKYPGCYAGEVLADSIGQYIGMKDINKQKIYSDVDIVKFKYRELRDFTLDQTIELTGTFHYDEVELRYQIDIIYDPKHPQYLCLNYMYDRMSDFEIIDQI